MVAMGNTMTSTVTENGSEFKVTANYQQYDKKNNIFKAPDRPIRDGIELEKGTSLTTDYLEEHLEDIENIMGIFVAYPDLYLDTIATEFSHSLFLSFKFKVLE